MLIFLIENEIEQVLLKGFTKLSRPPTDNSHLIELLQLLMERLRIFGPGQNVSSSFRSAPRAIGFDTPYSLPVVCQPVDQGAKSLDDPAIQRKLWR